VVALASKNQKSKLARQLSQVPFITPFERCAVIILKQRYVPDYALKEISLRSLNSSVLADDYLLFPRVSGGLRRLTHKSPSRVLQRV
jgi:hypothetical protein